jgi:hypothetical protein
LDSRNIYRKHPTAQGVTMKKNVTTTLNFSFEVLSHKNKNKNDNIAIPKTNFYIITRSRVIDITIGRTRKKSLGEP